MHIAEAVRSLARACYEPRWSAMKSEYHWIRGIDSCVHVSGSVMRLFQIARFERFGGEGIAGAADKDKLGVPSKKDILLVSSSHLQITTYFAFCSHTFCFHLL